MSNVESETGEKETVEAVENGVTDHNAMKVKEETEVNGANLETKVKEDAVENEDNLKMEVKEEAVANEDSLKAEVKEEAVVNEANLNTRIVRQIEYYFGDINLPRDRFLQEQVKLDDGWVPLEVMLKFKRLASLTMDVGKIVAALEEASDLMEVNEEKTKVRRKTGRPLPVFNEERRKELCSRTVYCKGFESEGTTLDSLLDYFSSFGEIDNVQMRTYKDKATSSYLFKGSVFVTFATKDLAAEFLNKESVKYKNVELIRKWQITYIEDKRKERQEKKMSKGQGKKQEEVKVQPKEELPKGAFLHLKGISQETTREDIKEKLISLGADVAFVDFSKGNTDAHIRLQGENSSKEFMEKLGDAKLEICDVELEVRSLEGEEEEAYKQKTIENMEKRRQNSNFRNKWGRKGGRGGRGNQGNKRKGSPVSGGPPSKKAGKSGSEVNADVVKLTDGGDD